MQINSIRPKTGMGDYYENKKPRVVPPVCSSTTHLDLHSYLPTRYHPNILNSFGVTEHTQKFVKKCKGK